MVRPEVTARGFTVPTFIERVPSEAVRKEGSITLTQGLQGKDGTMKDPRWPDAATQFVVPRSDAWGLCRKWEPQPVMWRVHPGDVRIVLVNKTSTSSN